MKKNIFVVIVFTIALSIAIIIYGNKENEKLPVYWSSATWMYDTSTPETAIGISNYAFVAKIDKILRTEYKNPVEVEVTADGKTTQTIYDPHTIYELTVVDNIKGQLVTNKPIELMQYGGLNKDGKSYTLLANTELLIPGNYYILLTNVWPEENILEVSEPTRIINLGNDIGSSDSKNMIELYKKAYINEIVPNDFTDNNLISKYDISYVK